MTEWEELRERGSQAFDTMSPQEHQEEHDRCLIFGSNIDISVLHFLMILLIHGCRGGEGGAGGAGNVKEGGGRRDQFPSTGVEHFGGEDLLLCNFKFIDREISFGKDKKIAFKVIQTSFLQCIAPPFSLPPPCPSPQMGSKYSELSSLDSTC